MGGRLGNRMDGVNRVEIGGTGMINNMNMRGEEESVIADDDEPIMEDDFYSNKKMNPPKNMIEREPEREPDYSNFDGNISHSVTENEKSVGNQR
jgi:hypothetical protein